MSAGPCLSPDCGGLLEIFGLQTHHPKISAVIFMWGLPMGVSVSLSIRTPVMLDEGPLPQDNLIFTRYSATTDCFHTRSHADGVRLRTSTNEFRWT